jgi:hypothetical protein
MTTIFQSKSLKGRDHFLDVGIDSFSGSVPMAGLYEHGN